MRLNNLPTFTEVVSGRSTYTRLDLGTQIRRPCNCTGKKEARQGREDGVENCGVKFMDTMTEQDVGELKMLW